MLALQSREEQNASGLIGYGSKGVRGTLPITPFIHKNITPEYQAMLLRTSDHSNHDKQFTLWLAVVYTPGIRDIWPSIQRSLHIV